MNRWESALHDGPDSASAVVTEQKIYTGIALFLAALAVTAGSLGFWWSNGGGNRADASGADGPAEDRSLPFPRPLADFTLTNSAGQPVTRADLLGKYLVVNFVFTSCSLGCPSDLRMAEIQRLVSEMPEVRLVSFSTDPRTDTPEALARLAARLRAETDRWIFLTGQKQALYSLIETSFFKSSPELAGILPGGFECADRLMLVDRDGRVTDSFNGMARAASEEVVARIRSLQGKDPKP